MSNSTPHRWRRIMHLACLIIAGETVFSLPYHVARFFRPTLLEVFHFTNTELGAVQSLFGVLAMASYFPGGVLADRFSARRLISVSLLATSAGGLYFASIPDHSGMLIVSAYWGVTTTLLFWAALIRSTREWGGHDKQGAAYGILDAGRGLLGALMAAAALLLFSANFPESSSDISDVERTDALRRVILGYTTITAIAAGLAWVFIPDIKPTASRTGRRSKAVMNNIAAVARLPQVWLQAAIVICAYVSFRAIDNYSLYAADVYGMSEVGAATVSTLSAWARPVAALSAGLLGDRFRPSRVVFACFLVLALSQSVFAISSPDPSATWILYLNITVACTAAFGLRGLYFALFEEGAVPAASTGTAVGIVCLLGYTPDIFVAPVAGWLLDRDPGVGGHQSFFAFIAAFAVLGLIVTTLFALRSRKLASPGAPIKSRDS